MIKLDPTYFSAKLLDISKTISNDNYLYKRYLNYGNNNSNNKASFGFELFPPRTNKTSNNIEKILNKLLSKYQTSRVSVTCGAGGSQDDGTLDLIHKIKSNYPNITLIPHLACINSDLSTIKAMINHYCELGLTDIMAIRGDIKDENNYNKDYKYATDLIKLLNDNYNFDITVATYPEAHPQSSNIDFEIDILKKKFDAGAKQAITQFFFDPDDFLIFRDKAVKAGIKQPIIAGILPMGNVAASINFANRCGTKVPKWVSDLGDIEHNHPELHLGTITSAWLTSILLKEGVEKFHIFTLNNYKMFKKFTNLLIQKD